MELNQAMLELIRRCTTDLSPDVENAVKQAYDREDEGTAAKNVFGTIIENIGLAREASTPICQDTGSVIIYVDFPVGDSEKKYREAAEWAAAEATKLQYLRPNAVDPVTGKNSGNNIGVNALTSTFISGTRMRSELDSCLKAAVLKTLVLSINSLTQVLKQDVTSRVSRKLLSTLYKKHRVKVVLRELSV